MQFDTLFPVHNPGKRAHPQNEILVPRKARISNTPCFFATLSQRNAKKPTQKTAQILDTPCFFTTLNQRNAKNLPENSTNFSNTIILCYLEPAKCQKNNQKTRISYQTALIDPSHNAKESISFS